MTRRAAGRAKKKARERAERLPTLEVDVDDDAAIGAVAEALVTAILAAAAGGERAPKKRARTAKKGHNKPAKKATKAKAAGKASRGRR